MKELKILVPGAVVTGENIEITAPFDFSVIAVADVADSAVVEKALTTADELFRDKSKWLSLPERLAILEKAVQIMQGEFEELAVAAAEEGGKPLLDSQVEVARAIDGVKLCIETMRTEAGQLVPMGANPASAG
ncbi:MAG: aldehyde dehydrogenase family protein, partial [Porticoccus sp.]|nr:aldehyde dehydrogenase family protein [Porticoccus sp.]